MTDYEKNLLQRVKAGCKSAFNEMYGYFCICAGSKYPMFGDSQIDKAESLSKDKSFRDTFIGALKGDEASFDKLKEIDI